MRLYLVRHGQTEFNVRKLWTGQMDIPLTEEGRQQAAAIRPKLEKIPFDRVYASDLSRAMETQRIILPWAEPVVTPVLREINVGTLERTPVIVPDNPENAVVRRTLDFTPYGGENVPMLCERARKFLQRLEEEPCQNAAVFSHNGFLTSVLQVVLKADIDRSAVNSRNCAVHVFEYAEGKWRLLAWNYMAEL